MRGLCRPVVELRRYTNQCIYMYVFTYVYIYIYTESVTLQARVFDAYSYLTICIKNI